MLKYEKMLFEVLINYIPKISNSLDEISEELKELNYSIVIKMCPETHQLKYS